MILETTGTSQKNTISQQPAERSSTPNAVATEGHGRGGSHYIGQGHAVPLYRNEAPKAKIHRLIIEDLSDEKLILMLRDPRDIVVSGSYHWKRPIRQFIVMVATGKWPVPHGGGLVQFYHKWLDSGLAHCVTRYEWLHENTEQELGRILDEIGIEAVKPLVDVVHRQSFEQRRAWTKQHGDGLNYGKEFQLQFLRKGIVGDWQNHFGEQEIKLCDHYFGEFMDAVSYKR